MPRHGRGWALRGDPRHEVRHSPLAVSLVEPSLLALLKEHAGHGYTLLSELNAMGMTTVHPSVVYRTLRDMEDLNWIRSDWDTDQTQGPPRRIYQLTPQGEEALQYWRQELGRTNELILQLLNKI